MLTGRETIYHECTLPIDHPQYRTQDYCTGCNVWRALTSPDDRAPAGRFAPQHANGVDICTIVGCEVCS